MGGMTHREKGAALQGGVGGTSVPRDLIESGNLTIMESPASDGRIGKLRSFNIGPLGTDDEEIGRSSQEKQKRRETETQAESKTDRGRQKQNMLT